MENVRNTASGWLRSRNLLIGVAVVGGGAMFLGWDWLVAVGAATFIVALAPCAVMCALGLCASRMGKKDTGAGSGPAPSKEADSQAPVILPGADAGAVDQAKANDLPHAAKRAA